MENPKLKEALYQKTSTGEKRREMLRKAINQCYKHDIKSLKDPRTLECSFDLAYDLFHNTEVYK